MGYIKRKRICGIEITFVFKHRFSTSPEMHLMNKFTWNDWKIGLWWKVTKAIGQKPNDNDKIVIGASKNLVKQFMIGLDLLVIKFWFTFNKGKIFRMEIKDGNDKRI